MRLEKVAYEKIINTHMFGRQRKIGSPIKWYFQDREKAQTILAHQVMNKGITGTIFRVLEPVIAWVFWKWPRDIALQRGLAPEDFELHTDREQRRDYFTESIWRQSCHPYQPLLFKRRRARYYKVERAVRGFFVPDYIRKEAEQRTYADTIDLMEEWNNFVYKNYYSDMTPTTHKPTMVRYLALEIINVYGILRDQAWERYFFNEATYVDFSDQELAEAQDPFPEFDLETQEGRRAFEAEANRFLRLYPGSVLPEGESFDFKEFYAKWAITTQRDTGKFDPKLIEELKAKLTADTATSYALVGEEKKSGHSTLGKSFPKALKQSINRAIMPK
mmetsp:Transcript_40905/g.47561  ORF Transcript_40905/g.47561 Transcript_40905/m.47561 type:complete len:332 (+) Transcript_40905:39-1034(+)